MGVPTIGFRRLSDDSFLKLQANRWLVTERAVSYFLPVVPRTTRIADWVQAYLDPATESRSRSTTRRRHSLPAARSSSCNPTTRLRPRIARGSSPRFSGASHWNPTEYVPFEGGALPAYELADTSDVKPPTSTWVIFGGFDSYIEESFPVLASVALARPEGYRLRRPRTGRYSGNNAWACGEVSGSLCVPAGRPLSPQSWAISMLMRPRSSVCL